MKGSGGKINGQNKFSKLKNMYVKPGQICIEIGEIQFLDSVMRGINKKLVVLT